MTPEVSWGLGVFVALSAYLHFRSAPTYGWGRVFEVLMGVAAAVIAALLVLGMWSSSAPEEVPGCVYDGPSTGYLCAGDVGIPGPTPAPEGDR